MRTSFFILALAVVNFANGQNTCDNISASAHFNGNDIRAPFTNTGSIILDPTFNQTFYPYNNDPDQWDKMIGVISLILAAKKPNGELIDAATDYPLPDRGDFCPGPIGVDNNSTLENCGKWNRIWQVFRDEIKFHIADFESDGTIDSFIPNIFAWPGNGNPYFQQFNGFKLPYSSSGFAPFYDKNLNNTYEPQLGEFPMVPGIEEIPSQILWAIMNDNCGGELDNYTVYAGSLNTEIQVTSYSFYCDNNPLLNRTLFNQWKIINKSPSNWDSLMMGLLYDWDYGCTIYREVGAGTYPEGQSVFNYMRTFPEFTGITCDSVIPDTIRNTLVSTTFHSHELLKTNVIRLPCTPFTSLRQPFEFLKGKTMNGYLTYGENGCNPTLPVAQFAFDGSPIDSSSWSMVSAGLPPADYHIIPSIYLGTLPPEAHVTITTSMTFHRQPDKDFAQNVQIMYEEIDSVRSFFQNGILSVCSREDCQGDCVWPGDINGDFIVNHCDLLPLGVHLGETGPTRSEGPFWHASEASEWNGNQANGKNLKHADGDGDGTIEIEDFHISENNYLYSVPGYTPTGVVYQEGPELYFTIIGQGQTVNPSHLKAGQHFSVNIWLNGPPNLYGLAFQIEFDTSYIKKNFSFYHGLQYYNQMATWVTPSRLEGNKYIIDFARVRTNHDSTIYNGILFTFFTGTHDSYSNTLPSASTFIRLRNIKGILNDGTEISLGSTDIELHIDDIMTGTSESTVARNLKVYPNPTGDYFNVSLTNRSSLNTEMRLVDIFGRTSFKKILLPGENDLQIAVADLPEGIYLLCIEDQAVEKVCVIR